MSESTKDTHRAGGSSWSVVLGTLGVALALVMIAFAIIAPLWQRLLFVAFALAAVVGALEMAWRRIELTEDGLLFVINFRQRFVPRADIDSVTWEKGAGVSLKLVNGQWLRLPDVGHGSQSLANSIRAWLRRTGIEATTDG